MVTVVPTAAVVGVNEEMVGVCAWAMSIENSTACTKKINFFAIDYS